MPESFRTFLTRFRDTEPDPAHDWLALLTLSCITFACIVVWNAWAFDTVVNGGTIGTTATSSFPLFSQESLSTIHAVFTNRAEEEVKYRTGTYRFADPSQ